MAHADVYVRRLRILRAIDRDILELRTPCQTAAWALRRLRSLVPYRRASVAELDLRNDKATLISVVSSIPTAAPKGSELPFAPFRKLLSTLQRGEVFMCPDIQALAVDSLHSETLIAEGCRSLLTAPLLHRRELIGTISLFEGKVGAYLREQAEIVSEVAGSLAVALQNNRLLGALRSSEERWRSLAENATEIVVVVDREMKIQFVNRPFPGLTREQLLGSSLFEWIEPEFQGIARDAIHDVFEKGQSRAIETHGLGLQAKASGNSTQLVPLEANGVVDSMALLVTDVTEKNRAQAAFASYPRAPRSLASKISLAEEKLRRQIAGELHDRTLQNLAICRGKLQNLAASGDDETREKLADVGELLEATIQDTRSLVFELSPPVLYELGLEAAIDWLSELFGRRHNLRCNVDIDGTLDPLEEDTKVTLFQSVRELLANVVRHAKTREATVKVGRWKDRVECSVRDEGPGFDPSSLKQRWKNSGGFGLFLIRERLRTLGGSVEIESAPGLGCHVRLILPVPASDPRRPFPAPEPAFRAGSWGTPRPGNSPPTTARRARAVR